jgi:outer membrane lipoprotein-sorting protein
MARPLSVVIAIAVPLTCLLLSEKALSVGPETPALEAVLKAWNERQAKVRSATAKWTEEKTKARGSVFDEDMAKKFVHDKQPIPRADITYQALSHLMLDRDKMRYWHRHMDWNASSGRQGMQDYLAVFNGSSSKIFHPPDVVEFPRGTIRNEKTHADVNNVYTRAILLWCRATHPVLGPLRNAQFTDQGIPAKLGDSACVVLQDKSMGGAADRRYWVDVTRDYVVRRYTLGADGKIEIQLDIDYKQDTKAGWAPSGWTLVWTRPNGKLRESSKATVTELLVNTNIPSSEFEIRFPPGTWVTDMTRESQLGKFMDYIQKDGEETREVLRADAGASYEQLATTNPGEAFGPKVNYYLWSGLAFAILGALLVVLLYLHRRRRATVHAD